jgi:O-antigen/teichoic acid export membrane protein
MGLLIVPFITALTPTIINVWEKNRDEAEHNLQKLSRYFLMLSLPALIGFNSLSKPIISILTTPQYYGGQLIFPFVTTGAFFMGLYLLSYTGLIIHEKTRLIAKIITISAILNILLNLVLIPYYGFIGAGISTMIAYFVAFVIADRTSSKYLKWRPVTKSVVKIFFASVMMGIIVYSISALLAISLLNLILEILIGCIVYLLVLYLLRGVEKEEIKEVKAMIRNMREKI